jgi:hypothetical protein
VVVAGQENAALREWGDPEDQTPGERLPIGRGLGGFQFLAE